MLIIDILIVILGLALCMQTLIGLLFFLSSIREKTKGQIASGVGAVLTLKCASWPKNKISPDPIFYGGAFWKKHTRREEVRYGYVTGGRCFEEL